MTSATSAIVTMSPATAAAAAGGEEALMMLTMKKMRDEIEKKTARARKAMGVRKNEANPVSILRMISQWEFEMNVALYKEFQSK